MRRVNGRTLVAVLAAVSLAGAAAAQHAGHGDTTPSPKASPGHTHEHGGHMGAGMSGSKGMHHHMMAGMKDMQKMKMTGDADVDFAMMMARHHQHGIEMARIELRDGDDETMKEMAQKIIEAQEKELRQLREWLAAKGHPQPEATKK